MFIARMFIPGQWFPYRPLDRDKRWMKNRGRYVRQRSLRISSGSILRYHELRRGKPSPSHGTDSDA